MWFCGAVWACGIRSRSGLRERAGPGLRDPCGLAASRRPLSGFLRVAAAHRFWCSPLSSSRAPCRRSSLLLARPRVSRGPVPGSLRVAASEPGRFRRSSRGTPVRFSERGNDFTSSRRLSSVCTIVQFGIFTLFIRRVFAFSQLAAFIPFACEPVYFGFFRGFALFCRVYRIDFWFLRFYTSFDLGAM